MGFFISLIKCLLKTDSVDESHFADLHYLHILSISYALRKTIKAHQVMSGDSGNAKTDFLTYGQPLASCAILSQTLFRILASYICVFGI